MGEKGQLSSRAEALLQDMARDHGLRGLAFDKDGMRVSQEYGNFIFTKGALQPYKAAGK